jgi:sulfur dioxygenase
MSLVRPVAKTVFDQWIKGTQRSGVGPLLFRQMFEKESCTYTYLVADPVTKSAILIDPVLETVDRDCKLVTDLGLNLEACLNTHCHADHTTGSGRIKTIFPECKSIIAEASEADADVKLQDMDEIRFGGRSIFAFATPGHTAGCMSFVMDDHSAVFTGDALLIRGCGRTDFQGGSAAQLYESVHTRIFTLPEACMVWPAHNYV